MNPLATLCLLLFFLSSMSHSQHIKRIEPANWWVGMHYHRVTLLIYGTQLSDLNVSTSSPDVEIQQVEAVENPNYLFVTLNILPTAKPGNVLLLFRRQGNLLFKQEFPLLPRTEGSASRSSFSPKDAIYLIVPDRFSNGDTTNDTYAYLLEKGINRQHPFRRHGGDIQGIINHLDYIQSLGITQIWCTPLVENNESEQSYHGYAATDFYRIDPRYGNHAQFKKMVEEARQRGIGVLWDVVLNHCGTHYYFIKDLPTKDWVNFSRTHTSCNFSKATLIDRYASEIDKQEYVNGWFSSNMADLNQRHPLVASFLKQNTLWWIESTGISGLRVDTYSFSDAAFLVSWTKTILEEYPSLNIVGEEMSTIAAQVSYWQKDKKNADGYESVLPSLMDFALTENVISSLNKDSAWFSSWRDTHEGIAQDYLFPHPEHLLIFPDNHDLDRFYTRIHEHLAHWKLGIALYMTMRGIPQFLYGTEVLMTNKTLGNDGERRGDFWGGWKKDRKNARTGVGLSEDEKTAKAYFTKLLQWRKTNTAITQGKLLHYVPQSNDVYVYFRYNDEQKVMVVLNKNSEEVALSLDRYAEGISATFRAKDIVSGQLLDVHQTLLVPPKTAMILEIVSESKDEK